LREQQSLEVDSDSPSSSSSVPSLVPYGPRNRVNSKCRYAIGGVGRQGERSPNMIRLAEEDGSFVNEYAKKETTQVPNGGFKGWYKDVCAIGGI